MFIILINATNNILLAGFVPESLELFVFGVGLIIFAVGLRWLLNRHEKIKNQENFNQVTEKLNR